MTGVISSSGSYFNPRPPRGERRAVHVAVRLRAGISIHAPLTGSDRTRRARTTSATYFNPRPPRGERLGPAVRKERAWEFQSTPPSRGATYTGQGHRSIHHHFNPRPPRGERPRSWTSISWCVPISIHAPLAGSDLTY